MDDAMVDRTVFLQIHGSKVAIDFSLCSFGLGRGEPMKSLLAFSFNYRCFGLGDFFRFVGFVPGLDFILAQRINQGIRSRRWLRSKLGFFSRDRIITGRTHPFEEIASDVDWLEHGAWPREPTTGAGMASVCFVFISTPAGIRDHLTAQVIDRIGSTAS